MKMGLHLHVGYHRHEFKFDRGSKRNIFLDHLQNLILRKNGNDGDYLQNSAVRFFLSG